MIRLFILLFAVLTSFSCVEYRVENSDPAVLLGDFMSFSTIEEIDTSKSSGNLRVIEDSGLSKDDPRPAFNIYTVSMSYRHLQTDGELVLHYFNDRLTSTRFYPSEEDAYLEELKNNGIDLMEENKLDLSEYTRVWKYKDFQNKFYVGWEDIRLINEQHEWIEEYS